MSDEELKNLVASLAISQAKTDEELNKLAISQAKTEKELEKFIANSAISKTKIDEKLDKLAVSQAKTDEELKKFIANSAISKTKIDEKLDKLAVSQAKTDEELEKFIANSAISQAKTDEGMKELQRKIDKVAALCGNIGQNQGDIAEEFFYNSLIKKPKLGSIKFDDMITNLRKHRGNTQEEYDIILTNGESIGIIEVKYKTHTKDIDKLKRKVQNYKKLFPIYRDFKVYGAIAGFFVPFEVEEKANEEGFFVLKRKGKIVESKIKEIKSY